MSAGFKPYRVDLEFFPCKDAPIKPLVQSLSFIESKTHPGAAFQFGSINVPEIHCAPIANP